MRYGLPYKGSKNAIAKDIVDFLPKARHFYDLFAGGCAITHAAMLSGKWEQFTINDINPGIITLFNDAVAGKYRNEKRWISREDFFRLKDADPYVRYCWSFGNDGTTYLYGREIEPYKELLWKIFHASTSREAYDLWRQFERLFDRGKGFGSLESLQSLQSLESLESLSMDYRSIKIEPDSVIYCDIPYTVNDCYTGDFDHAAFYDWAERQSNIFISEYWMPEDRFECVWSKERHSHMSAVGNDGKRVEKIFTPRHCNEQ